jgi:hypothetical protein
MRAVARVFEADPNTVLGWPGEAAEHPEAFCRYGWRAMNVEQVQMDELFALRVPPWPQDPGNEELDAGEGRQPQRKTGVHDPPVWRGEKVNVQSETS